MMAVVWLSYFSDYLTPSHHVHFTDRDFSRVPVVMSTQEYQGVHGPPRFWLQESDIVGQAAVATLLVSQLLMGDPPSVCPGSTLS